MNPTQNHIARTPIRTAAFIACLAGMLVSAAAQTQIGDFRIGSTVYAGTWTYFDPGFGPHTTRPVVSAPVQVNSAFIGTSQNPDGILSATDDIGLQTYSSSTVIRTLNRFTSSPDGGTSGPNRAGAVQWSFDLTPLDTYLAANNLQASGLTLALPLTTSDATRRLDVYLSYSSTDITLSDISTTSGVENYNSWWWPAQASSVGSIVDGRFQILELGTAGNLDLSVSLLPLYEAGVRDFNLILVSGDFWSSRSVFVPDGSGLFLTTTAVPEPAVSSLLVIGLVGFVGLGRRKSRS